MIKFVKMIIVEMVKMVSFCAIGVNVDYKELKNMLTLCIHTDLDSLILGTRNEIWYAIAIYMIFKKQHASYGQPMPHQCVNLLIIKPIPDNNGAIIRTRCK